MRKIDISHRYGIEATNEQVKELEELLATDGDSAVVLLKTFKKYDMAIDVVIYPEKDIGLPPTILTSTSGGTDATK